MLFTHRMLTAAALLLALILSGCEEPTFITRRPSASDPVNQRILQQRDHRPKPADTGFGAPNGPAEQ